VRDPVPVGELDQRTPAIAAEARLQAAGCVVQTGVEDAGVVSALVNGDPILLVEHGEAELGALLEECHRRREPDETRADDRDVELVAGHAYGMIVIIASSSLMPFIGRSVVTGPPRWRGPRAPPAPPSRRRREARSRPR